MARFDGQAREVGLQRFGFGLVPSMITRTWALNPTVSAFGSDVISALTAEIETAGARPRQTLQVRRIPGEQLDRPRIGTVQQIDHDAVVLTGPRIVSAFPGPMFGSASRAA